MTMLSPTSIPVDLMTPAISAPTAGSAQGSEAAKRASIAQSAQNFESQFLSSMLGEMFEGVSTDGPFGGGQGEQMFRSFMTDAFGKQMAKSGGVGVAAAVQREMLKMQGLS
jgi:peptidoglycan hydrolase FlgJ